MRYLALFSLRLAWALPLVDTGLTTWGCCWFGGRNAGLAAPAGDELAEELNNLSVADERLADCWKEISCNVI